ncbi:hypothetical protein [Glycomyces paridis]|uniref:Uncharacterized protein n=1 Tax=Glycomyces paridis TaxID=2126555 RepID=A0A4S8P6U7_9ACTN|nr:hypothetical protein [Glycomyces paridis]THV25988.1 hypothetical protein E9998_19840 [Glycomyces paridis]
MSTTQTLPEIQIAGEHTTGSGLDHQFCFDHDRDTALCGRDLANAAYIIGTEAARVCIVCEELRKEFRDAGICCEETRRG